MDEGAREIGKKSGGKLDAIERAGERSQDTRQGGKMERESRRNDRGEGEEWQGEAAIKAVVGYELL